MTFLSSPRRVEQFNDFCRPFENQRRPTFSGQGAELSGRYANRLVDVVAVVDIANQVSILEPRSPPTQLCARN